MLQQSLFAPTPPWALAVLAALGRHRFLSTTQLAFSLRKSVDEVEAALEPLVAGKLLARLETPLVDPAARVLACALTVRGARLLAASTGRPVAATTNVARSVYLLAHELACADFGLRLEALAEAGRIRLRAWETAASRIGQVAHLVEKGVPSRVPIVADALAVVEDARPTLQGLLVEQDMGTVSAERMARKYRGYLAWFRDGGHVRRFGLPSLRVLTIVPDVRRRARLESLARAATEGRGSGLFWFALHEPVSAELAVHDTSLCTVANDRYPEGVPLLDLRNSSRSRSRPPRGD